MSVYDVRLFNIQNLANTLSRHRVPHFSNMPSKAGKRVRLLRATKGPVEIVNWDPIHTDAIAILDDFA
jgi:hypothetical protein